MKSLSVVTLLTVALIGAFIIEETCGAPPRRSLRLAERRLRAQQQQHRADDSSEEELSPDSSDDSSLEDARDPSLQTIMDIEFSSEDDASDETWTPDYANYPDLYEKDDNEDDN
jgi:hypothetical protein